MGQKKSKGPALNQAQVSAVVNQLKQLAKLFDIGGFCFFFMRDGKVGVISHGDHPLESTPMASMAQLMMTTWNRAVQELDQDKRKPTDRLDLGLN